MKRAWIFLALGIVHLHGEFKEWSEFSAILKPSPIEGVGVFAAHDIKAGTKLFTVEYPEVEAHISEVPSPFLKFCPFVDNDHVLRPERFDTIGIVWFINHSFNPNIILDAEGDFSAARDILQGEELLKDYNILEEPEHLKEPFFRKK